jgi:large subunit ribosomal protein L10
LALSRQQKEQLLQGYAEKLEHAQVMVWAKYGGLTVAQVSDLRRQLRPSGAQAVVVKNTLLRLALEQKGLPVDAEMMGGSCVVTFINDNLPAAITALSAFARANDAAFQLKGGVVGGKLASTEQVSALATLPSREVLLARVVGGIQAPISGFVGTLAAVMRGLVNVLDAHSKQLQESPAN